MFPTPQTAIPTWGGGSPGKRACDPSDAGLLFSLSKRLVDHRGLIFCFLFQIHNLKCTSGKINSGGFFEPEKRKDLAIQKSSNILNFHLLIKRATINFSSLRHRFLFCLGVSPFLALPP